MPAPAGPGLPAIHTLADLDNWPAKKVSLAVIGHPIGHSISPPMHNAALKAMARDDAKFKEWEYFRFDIRPKNLESALDLMHSRGFRGLNLTIPHKVDAVGLVADIDPAARQMGAVNTLLRQDRGYKGFNTDGFGLEQALLRELGAKIPGQTIIILGAGGAARAAAVHCLQRDCPELWIGNRSRRNLQNLLDILSQTKTEAAVNGFDLSDPPADLPESGVLINATSLGLKKGDPPPISLRKFSQKLKVLDMVYNPPETQLLGEARERGMATANGLSMLVWQGARSLEIWTGREIPAMEMSAAVSRALA